MTRFIVCGDCIYCDPDFYDGDDECSSEDCHPGYACNDDDA